MNDLTAQMEKILNDYGREVAEKVDKIADEAAKSTVAELKRTSPKSGGGGKHYANGWTVKKTKVPAGGSMYTVYNKTKPQLTHLLEKGHVIRNQKGTYGRARAIRHIEPAEQHGVEKFVRDCEHEL